MSFLVRRLTRADLVPYSEMRRLGLTTEVANFGMGSLSEVEAAEDWGQRLETTATFGAHSDDRLVGIATLTRDTMSKVRHRGHVSEVFVRREERGRGIAKALMRALIEDARRDCVQLHLFTSVESIGARRLYEGLGFVTYGIDPRGMALDGRFVDDCMMVLRLDEGRKDE